MNKAVSILILILVLIGGFILLNSSNRASNTAQKSSVILSTPQKWSSEIDEQANVTVTVMPEEIVPSSNEWGFYITMSTHSVELDQDMTKVATLIDGLEKEYVPLRWEGTPTGGHHREGTLVFEKIDQDAKSITLKVYDIGGVERNFYWQLE